jgi:hypothetical protein
MSDKKVDYKIPKHRVSGVPYEVDLTIGKIDDLAQEDLIAVLEQENRLMRARMDRLEDDLRVANELIHKLNLKILNQGHHAFRND